MGIFHGYVGLSEGKTTSIYILKHTFQYTGWVWGMICNHLKTTI